jgi:hypothetical protein
MSTLAEMPTRGRRLPAAPARLPTLTTGDPAHLLGLLACAGTFALWLGLVCGGLSLAVFLFCLLLPLALHAGGRSVLLLFPRGDRAARSLPLVLLTGGLALPLALFALKACLPGALRLHTLVVLAVVLLPRRRPAVPRPSAPRAGDWAGLFAVCFGLIAATFWSRGLLRSVRPEGDAVLFGGWMDFFVHANVAARFLPGSTLWSLGNYELAGLPAGLYHYAGYLYPAALADFTGTSTHAAVLGLWAPLGTFLMGLAAYTLAAAWRGRSTGLCALAALVCLPDASHYAARNPYLAYHWKVQINPALLYGLAAAALALAAVSEGMRRREPLALAAGIGLGLASVLFNGKLVVQCVPLLVLWSVLAWPAWRWPRRLLSAALLLAVAVAAVWLGGRLGVGPRLSPDAAYFESFARGILPDTPGQGRAWCADLPRVLFAGLGIWLLAYPVLLLASLWRDRLRPPDLVPGLSLVLYAAILLGVRDDGLSHNPYELLRNGFVLPYFLTVAWCAARAAGLLGIWDSRVGICGAAVVSLSVLLLLPFSCWAGVQEGKTVWRFAYCNLRYPRGEVECARFLRMVSAPGDIVQDGAADPHLLVGGLSERRSFLGRPLEWSKNPRLGLTATVAARQDALTRLRQAATAEDLARQARETGIRWYLAHPEESLAWPASVRDAPAFASGGFRVYDLRKDEG